MKTKLKNLVKISIFASSFIIYLVIFIKGDFQDYLLNLKESNMSDANFSFCLGYSIFLIVFLFKGAYDLIRKKFSGSNYLDWIWKVGLFSLFILLWMFFIDYLKA